MKLYALMIKPLELEECASVDTQAAQGVVSGIKVEVVCVTHEAVAYMEKYGWRLLCADIDLIDMQIGEIREQETLKWNIRHFFQRD